MRSLRFSIFPWVLAAFASTSAQVGLLAGGGFHLPRIDNTSLEQERGMTGFAGFQLAGDRLGVALQGGYSVFASRGTPGGDSASRHETRLFEIQLLPKFYLRTGDIAAYVIGGGGPQWTSRETRPGDGGTTLRESHFDMGMQAGFGVEAAFSEAWSIGISPLYHAVYWNGRREFEYASLVFYLKL